ncbi:cupin domain-containing protein [Pedobacter sp. L105]|uniref:cupin domain-containing protein n=1 Tax=Pedobacter sp. L105 TaxID=1641871 RepID=UPI0020B14515|nr:cupin domain-containing protein [Pedobacter sp. L105]
MAYSGVFETTIGDQQRVLNPGDGFYIPSNEVHCVVFKKAGVLIDVFSPHREDFL